METPKPLRNLGERVTKVVSRFLTEVPDPDQPPARTSRDLPAEPTRSPITHRQVVGYQVPGKREAWIRLRSEDPAFPFEVALTIWAAVDSTAEVVPTDPAMIAYGGIITRAAEVAATRRVTEHERLHAELSMKLSMQQRVPDSSVIAWADCTGVHVEPEHRDAVRNREELERQQRVREWTWRSEEAEIAILADLLTDPLRATAWWLNHNQNNVAKLVEVAEDFRRLRDILAPYADTSHYGAGPSLDARPALEQPDSLARVVADFHSVAHELDAREAARRVHHLMDALGHTELARRAENLAFGDNLLSGGTNMEKEITKPDNK